MRSRCNDKRSSGRKSKARKAAKTCAIYARSATEAENSTAIGEQLRLLRSRAAGFGWSRISEYIDAPASGIRCDRPALRRLIADAEAGTVHIIAAWSLDRLSRNIADLFFIMRLMEKLGVQIYSLADDSFVHSRRGSLSPVKYVKAVGGKPRVAEPPIPAQTTTAPNVRANHTSAARRTFADDGRDKAGRGAR